MKTLITLLIFLLPNLSYANLVKVSCDGDIEFEIPFYKGQNPKLKYVYFPVQVTTLEFNNENLLLIAVDKNEPTRIRLTISAQADDGERVMDGQLYKGQIMADVGQAQMSLTNGPIHCVATTTAD